MNKTFSKIKELYFKENKFLNHLEIKISCCSPVEMAKVLTEFAPYLIQMYHCLFIETKEGKIGKCTCINDYGIKFEFLDGGYEWIKPIEIVKWGILEQEASI